MGARGVGEFWGWDWGEGRGLGEDRNNGADPRVKMRRGGELERIVGLLSIMVNMT